MSQTIRKYTKCLRVYLNWSCVEHFIKFVTDIRKSAPSFYLSFLTCTHTSYMVVSLNESWSTVRLHDARLRYKRTEGRMMMRWVWSRNVKTTTPGVYHRLLMLLTIHSRPWYNLNETSENRIDYSVLGDGFIAFIHSAR